MKRLLFIIIILTLGGCGQMNDPKPADLIPQERMIQVLADIHVADALVEHKTGMQNLNLPLTSALYNQIYKNNSITAEQYKTSYNYYEAHPALMDNMYTQVITELSKREALLKK